MRVTNNMLTQNLLWNVNQNLNGMNIYQKQLSSGKRVHSPSDDPVGVTKIIKYKSDIAQNAQYKTNTRDAIAWMEITENSLMDSKDILQRIRELTVQGANGTLTTQETSQIAKEVEQLKDELIKIGNAAIAGKYIFSGFNTNEPLFKKDGTFNINFTSEKMADFEFIEYETGPSTTMTINTEPKSIFGAVPLDNFVTQFSPKNVSAEGGAATYTNLTANFDLEQDHSAAAYVVTVDGTNYTVDSSALIGSAGNPMDKDAVLNAFNNAAAGANKLSSVADVYFDVNNELVIKSKTIGAGSTISIGGTLTNYNPMPANAGSNGTGATVAGTTNIPAGSFPQDVKGSFMITYNGVEKRIDLDLTNVASDAALDTAIQAKLDTAFGAGKVNVTVTEGASLSFTSAPNTDGTKAELQVDYIAAEESQLIADLNEMIAAFNGNDQATIKEALTKLDGHIDNMVTNLADVGARTNRLEFIDNRISDNELSLTKLLSEVQDVDVSKTIIMMKALENVYRASLSVGSKVIQPTLVDFIR